MSHYFVCSKNGKPVHAQYGEQLDFDPEENDYDQVNSFCDFNNVVKFLQQSPVPVPQPVIEIPAPAPVVESAPAVAALTEKQVAINLLREYRVVINEVLAKVKSNPLYAQVKAEFKKVFGDRFKTFFVKVQSELNG